MKFRNISRLIYLKRARHRHGHSIHSPFLFHLITKIIEDKKRLPEYDSTKKLKKKVLVLLNNRSDQSFTKVYQAFNLPPSNPRKLYRRVELPFRYGKVVFRLIREFKPSSVINYGPAFGAILALMAMANTDNYIYQVISDPLYENVCKELFNDLVISNIQFIPENSLPEVNPEFIVINYSNNPDCTQILVQKYIEAHGSDDVLIIKGIHDSKEMEAIWQEFIENDQVHVTLDLFEIGIAFFRKGLQKENFVLKY